MTMLLALHSSSATKSPGAPAPWTAVLRIGVPALLLAAVSGALALEIGTTPHLAAQGSSTQDSDGDGLTDLQEEILFTSPDLADTDGDGYSDLEEVCRQSDPLNKFGWPGPSNPKVGLVGRTRNGILTIVSTSYVEGGDFGGLGFQFGVVYQGVPIPLDLTSLGANQIKILPAKNPSDKIVVVETALPESLIHVFGALAFYGIHMGDGLGSRYSASALNLVSVGGIVVSLESAPATVHGGNGLIRRPLTSADGVPNDWNGGQICWQLTAVVGVNGSSIVYEVEDAGCEQMDTFCSPSDCAASIGGSIEVVDPGALIGG